MHFRYHRSTLTESLTTVVEVSNLTDLAELLTRESDIRVNPSALSTTYCGYDKRCDWDTWYVLLDGGCIGMADGDLST